MAALPFESHFFFDSYVLMKKLHKKSLLLCSKMLDELSSWILQLFHCMKEWGKKLFFMEYQEVIDEKVQKFTTR